VVLGPCEKVVNSRVVGKGILGELTQAVATTLKGHDFVKRAMLFTKAVGDNAAIIEFQRSRDRPMFTIDVGVVCGKLLPSGPSGLRKADITDAHLSQRLGFLLPGGRDKWWELTLETDVDSLAKEIAELLVTKAIPYLESFLSSDALIELWESGRSPGLTDVQRARFLSGLKKSRI